MNVPLQTICPTTTRGEAAFFMRDAARAAFPGGGAPAEGSNPPGKKCGKESQPCVAPSVENARIGVPAAAQPLKKAEVRLTPDERLKIRAAAMDRAVQAAVFVNLFGGAQS